MLDHVADTAVHGSDPDHKCDHRLANASRAGAQPGSATSVAGALWPSRVTGGVANTINIAADLAAMAEALRLVVGGPLFVYTVGFGLVCLTPEVFIPHHRYAGYLKFLTLVLLGVCSHYLQHPSSLESRDRIDAGSCPCV